MEMLLQEQQKMMIQQHVIVGKYILTHPDCCHYLSDGLFARQSALFSDILATAESYYRF